MRRILMIGLCLTLAGCAHAPKIIKPFVDPQYGMTKQQMMDLLGTPETVEIYKKQDQTRMEIDVYMRKYKSFQTKVPVCLVDNRIVGWGKAFYEDHVSQDDIRIK